ncbi:MAG: NUDIX hydrolase [Dehalococcoidia bacterium]
MHPSPKPSDEEQVVESRRLYEGRVVSLRVDRVKLPDGRLAVREVVEHAPVVAIVALDGQQNVLLVRQYRLPTGQSLLEIPAGGIDPGESAEEAAQRELQEETGQRAGCLEHLCSFFASPGYCDEYMHLYLATALEPSARLADADESIEVVRLPLSEALGLIERGEICDAKTILGLWAVAHRQKF